MELLVYKKDGSKGEETVTVNSNILDKKPNDSAIYFSVLSYMANQRQGTHSTKTRSMVRGGGKKPFKQKGTGRARAGTIRSPLWKGGGKVFGPHPHDYSIKIPKKMKKMARISAIAYKLKEGGIIIIEDFDFDAPKTKNFFSILKSLNIDKNKTLFVTEKISENLFKSCRNIQKITVRQIDSLSSYDIIHCEKFLIQKSAFEKLNEIFGSEK